MVAVISVDAYPFWLSQTWPVTLRIQEYVLSGCIVMPNGKETKLGSIDQEFSPSAGKRTRVVLVPCCTWTCVPTTVSSGVDTWETPRCHILRQMSSQWGSQKLLQRFVSHEHTVYFFVFDLFLTQWVTTILSKGCKPDNFESHSSLKLSFWMWIFPWMKLSWHSSSIWDKLGWLIDSGNFLVTGYLPLIQEDSVIHIHGLAVDAKEGLPFA